MTNLSAILESRVISQTCLDENWLSLNLHGNEYFSSCIEHFAVLFFLCKLVASPSSPYSSVASRTLLRLFSVFKLGGLLRTSSWQRFKNDFAPRANLLRLLVAQFRPTLSLYVASRLLHVQISCIYWKNGFVSRFAATMLRLVESTTRHPRKT